MRFFELRNAFGNQSRADRISLATIVIVTILAISAGLLLKQQASTDTWLFESRSAGIVARYPAGWIVEEGGSIVAQISNPRSRPFKTQFAIATYPLSGQSSTKSILDSITLQRSSILAGYRVLEVSTAVRESRSVTSVRFAFVIADPNPFIQQLPVVVLGEDFVIVDGNRALVVTYENYEARFESERGTFDRFYESIRY